VVEPPRNETEALWENFLDCIRSRKQSTFSPPDLGAAAVAVTAMAELSYFTGHHAMFWDRDRREVARPNSTWPERWAERSKSRGKPNQVFGWTGGDAGSTLHPPAHQKLAGPWANGKDPAV